MNFTNFSDSSVSLPASLGPVSQVACFSVVNKIVKPNTTETLASFCEPPARAALQKGKEAFIKRYRNDPDVFHPRPLDNLFRTCLETDPQIIRTADVVTWRGIVVKIMLGVKLDLNMSFIDGVLYLDEHDSTPKSPGHFLSSYPGQSFEAYCTNPITILAPNPTTQINLHNLWCTVFARKLGDLNLVLGAEVDCIRGQYTGQPSNYIELKTRTINLNRRAGSEGPIHKKWYLQSHMAGVPTLFVGRHVNDTLQSTEYLQTDTIPALVPHWNPQTDFDWGCKVLTFLREFCLALGEGERVVVRRVEVRSKSSSGITIKELTQPERHLVQTRGGKQRIGIIPATLVQSLRAAAESSV